jgi:hypothetical protein
MELYLALPRSVRPPVTPIALRDLTRDRLFALFQQALFVLPRAFIEIGDDARAFLALRGITCLELLMPIRTGT